MLFRSEVALELPGSQVGVERVDIAAQLLDLRICDARRQDRAGQALQLLADDVHLPRLGLADHAHEGAARLPARYRDPDNFWTAHNEFVFTPAYNSDLIKEEDAPKSLDDLLDARWKGRMVWSAQPIASGAPGFIGLVLAARGETAGMDFLRKLALQGIAAPKVSARQVLDQVIAGEYALGPHTFNHQSVISAAKGAPVAWIPASPAMAVLSVGAIVRGGPNPNAAKLLADFLFSDEGQKIFRDSDYIPVDPSVPPRAPALRPDGVNFRAIYMTPEDIEAGLPRWTRLYADLFR